MVLVSFKVDKLAGNRSVYVCGGILSIGTFILSKTLAKRFSKIASALVYVCYIIYYMYGILIGGVTEPDGKTVTFIVMLVIVPVIFIVRPIHTYISTVSFVEIFVVLCILNKHEPVLYIDIVNAILFGILGCVSGTISNKMKVYNFIHVQHLNDISRIDQMTQLRNRNAYEIERWSIPAKCKHRLGCVFIDVNDLHEINNTKSHKFGDEMLQQIAKIISDLFTNQYAYRIGGDEFVIFIPDIKKCDLGKMNKDLISKVEAINYHVAAGYDVAEVYNLNLNELIASADEYMKYSKDMYHKYNSTRTSRE